MDRFNRLSKSLALILFLGLSGNIKLGEAGIVLLTPEVVPEGEMDEVYPESHFGSVGSENRKPAGLEFSSNNSQVHSNPVINEKDVPTTPSNFNPLPDLGPRAGVQEIAVIATDLGFFPKTIFVTRDIPVRLFVTGASKKSLCIMMDSFQVKKQIQSQKMEEISFTPSIPGQYRFYCPVNGMEGTLLVKEISTVSRKLSSSENNR